MPAARTRCRWQPPPPADAEQAAARARKLGVHPLVATLLAARGIDDPEQTRRFLHPKLTDLSDPAATPGVDHAAARIAQAIGNQQPIVIYGDYDVDGVTASAILWHVLRACGGVVSTYIPHRIDEGYGLNEDAIRSIARGQEREATGVVASATHAPLVEAQAADGAMGPRAESEEDQTSDIEHRTSTTPPLIVSVDCGITAMGPAKVARELGIDLIITDHHQFDPNALPDAYALVHPGLATADDGCGMAVGSEAAGASDSFHPPSAIRHPPSPLCGAGVAFKLAWQVAKLHCGGERVSDSLRKLLLDLLSYVALGTVADVVPLVGENRVLTRFGLARMAYTPFVGLNALIDAARLRNEKVDSHHIGFILGPRLNACGRMGHAARALHLLTEAGEGDQAVEADARETAAFLTAENDRRRRTEREIFDQARQMVLDAGYDRDDCRAIVLAAEGWHPGVIGIVASRLVQAFHRPAVLLSVDNGTAKGSARSIDSVCLHTALTACQDHLDRFGGHAMAAGLALPTDGVERFRDALVEYVNDRLGVDDLVQPLRIDGEIQLNDCTLDLFEQIHALEPFGRGNARPLLMLRRVTLDRPALRIGGGGKHLSLWLRQDGPQTGPKTASQGPRVVRAVAFGMGERAEELPGGAVVDVAFEPKLSTWQGQRRVELHVCDVRPAE